MRAVMYANVTKCALTLTSVALSRAFLLSLIQFRLTTSNIEFKSGSNWKKRKIGSGPKIVFLGSTLLYMYKRTICLSNEGVFYQLCFLQRRHCQFVKGNLEYWCSCCCRCWKWNQGYQEIIISKPIGIRKHALTTLWAARGSSSILQTQIKSNHLDTRKLETLWNKTHLRL